MRRLEIARPCSADYERMREVGGARFCDQCNEHVRDVRSDADAKTIMRDARRRGERWTCVRVFVASAALAACAPETTTVVVRMPPSPPGISNGFANQIYRVGSVEVKPSMWHRLRVRVRTVLPF